MPPDIDIRESIARHFWAQAAITELAERYKEKGYVVSLEEPIAGARPDLVARKDESIEIVEVKGRPWNDLERRDAEQLREFASKNPNTKFNLLWVSPPRQVDVEIIGLEEILSKIWEDGLDGSPVASLASSVSFENIGDHRVDGVVVKPRRIEVRGSGTAEFEMRYGSSSEDDGLSASDAYPFEFHIALDEKLQVEEVLKWEVDVSSYYE